MPDSTQFTPTFLKTLATLPVQGRLDISPAESPYVLPNNLNECKRLDLQHFIFREFFKRQYFAPIGQAQHVNGASQGTWTDSIIERMVHRDATAAAAVPKRILDVGCGTGQWAIDIAKLFPTTSVVGLDIVTPARPFPTPLPLNFAFLKANVLRGLMTLEDNSFDFVHMRCLGLGIPGHKWQYVINELARVTAPGGWIESVETSLPHDSGEAYTTIHTMLEAILTARSVDLATISRIDSYLRQATSPVQSISSYAVELPVGTAGGGHGTRMAWNLMLALDNLAPFFLQAHCWPAATWQQLRQQVEAEFSQGDDQASVTVSIVTGQKQ
jgi:ubiquinone/menaquinone biosynthesis C-methylase UbiE